MPISLANAALLTQDKLAQIVINEFRKDQLLDMTPFDDNVAMGGGSTLAYVYNRVTTLPTAATRALNAEFVAQEAITTQYTSNLKILGGSFQVDRVIANNVKGITNQIDFQLAGKIEATKAHFADLFINGDTGADVTQFDGIDKAITGSSTEANTGADIDLNSSADIDSNFKSFMDLMDNWLSTLDGTPSALLMNRSMLAVMRGIARRSNSFTTSLDEFGRQINRYADIPLIALGDKAGTANPVIPTAAGKTSIYAVRFGLDGVHAVTPDGGKIINTYLPDLSAPGAVKTGEVEFVTTVALKATRAAGAFRRILIA